MGPAWFSFPKFCLSFNSLFFSLSKLKCAYFLFIYLFIYLFIQSVPPKPAEHTTKLGSNLSLSLQITHPTQERLATPPGSTSPTIFEQWRGFFYVPQNQISESAVKRDLRFFRPYPGRVEHDSDRLQMSLQRQHFLLSYLQTLRVVSAGVWARDRDLLRSRPVRSRRS